MLPCFAQSPDWCPADPLFFDEAFCQSLLKDLQLLPTPPQSPPMTAGVGGTKPLSNEDQLSYVSDILLEDQDMQLGWNYDFFHDKPAGQKEAATAVEAAAACARPCSSLAESSEDFLWRCLAADKSVEEKLVSSVLGSSPLLSDIDTSVFEGLAGSMLDCQDLLDTREPSESTSDCGSTGGELSNYSSSDSEEEIDVVTVVRCPARPSPLPSLADLPGCRKKDEDHWPPQRSYFDIHLQHNYAAPFPASPPLSSCSSTSSSSSKRSRGSDGASRRHHPTRGSCSSSSSSSSSFSSRYQTHSSRHSAETEDEEERRRTHNVMERQRRNELKNCFLRLRDNVPELSHNDKASKVVILKKARDCIRGLEEDGQRLYVKRDRLRAKQMELKSRLEHLRR